MELIVHTDGASRGNPGPAAAAFIITDSSGKLITQSGKFLGITTNNQAEYHAVLLALTWIAHNQKNIRTEDGIFETIEEEPDQTLLSNKPGGDDEVSEDPKPSVSKKYRRGPLLTITFYLDSELVARQLSGQYKIKSKELLLLAIKIKHLQNSLASPKPQAKAGPISPIPQISFRSIPRSLNKPADRLVNQILDSSISSV